MTTDVIRKLEDVRPGDLYLGPIGGWVGAGVRFGELAVDGGFHVGPLNVCHIGVVVEASRTEPASDEWAAGVITAPKLAQAMPGGAEIIEMRYATHWTRQSAFARIPEDWPGQAEDAAAIARLMVEAGVGYSYGSYPALAAWRWGLSTPRLEKWIGRRRPEAIELKWSNGPAVPPYAGWTRGGYLPVEAICSVFADQAWSLAGREVMRNVPHQCVTPSQLGARLLMGMPGVVWGWPSVTPYP